MTNVEIKKLDPLAQEYARVIEESVSEKPGHKLLGKPKRKPFVPNPDPQIVNQNKEA